AADRLRPNVAALAEGRAGELRAGPARGARGRALRAARRALRPRAAARVRDAFERGGRGGARAGRRRAQAPPADVRELRRGLEAGMEEPRLLPRVWDRGRSCERLC